MFSNYFKTAWRNLTRSPLFSAINILGLSTGIACCLLIMLFVRSEFSYDRFHKKADRIYRVIQHEKAEGQDFLNTVTSLSTAQVMQQTYPEIENTCRVYGFNRLVRSGDRSFNEDIRMVDSTFFRMFDFTMIHGSRENPMPEPNTVLITPAIAQKYFGKEEAMGKTLELEMGNEKVPFQVTGIVQPAPEESSIRFQILIPYSNAPRMFGPGAFRSWFNVQSETFVLLRENQSPEALQQKFPAMIKAQLGEDYREGGFLLRLQPMKSIHLDNSLPSATEPVSNPKYAYIMATIGILLLLVACINFVTLSISRSPGRAREVGVRKVLGADRQQLLRQFWGESILLTTISMAIGVAAAVILLQPFNQLINRNLVFPLNMQLFLYCLVLIIVIGLVAGVYPAMVLSGFRPVEVLKGKLSLRGSRGWLRQTLVTGQFVASISMIISTILIGQQMKYIRNKDLGYDKEQLLVVATNKNRQVGMPLAALYQNELKKIPEVASASVSVYSMIESPWMEIGFTDEQKLYHSFQFNAVDAQFLQTMGIKPVAGRLFSADIVADGHASAIVNEAFVREFKLKDPVGGKLPGPFEQQIIGVVPDFHVESLHSTVRPLLLVIQPDSVLSRVENMAISAPPQPRISIRMKAGSVSANLARLEAAWKAVAPSQEFSFRFLDASLATRYEAEIRTQKMVTVASGLSIFIACMGLFGLTLLAVVSRVREIGIRKVLGAGTATIVGMFSREIIRLVLIATVLAAPLAWWFIHDWLKDFAYRIPIQWYVFLLAGLAALAIAMLTVTYLTIRAARANPVASLRSE